MESKDLTSIIDQSSLPKKLVTKAKIAGSSSMQVGGSRLDLDKADKKLVTLNFERPHISGRPIERGFVAKIYNLLPPDQVREIVQTYNDARKDGFKVPPTTRFFAYEDVYPSVLMTDMAEGGKYRVWGYNDSPKPEEGKTLNDMNLTEEDLHNIRNQVSNFVNLAESKGRHIHFHNYHIRQEIDTRKLEVFLLDLDPTFLNASSRQELQKQADNFLRILTLDPSEMKKSLD